MYRIAIINSGKLQCLGSPLFLKTRFGSGYTLTITKNSDSDSASTTTFLLSSVPGTQLLSSVGKGIFSIWWCTIYLIIELAYALPKEGGPNHMAHVLESLEAQKDRLGIDSYSISMSSLEELFLRIGKEQEGNVFISGLLFFFFFFFFFLFKF